MLRTDLFKTVERDQTRFIAVRDSLTEASPEIDAKHLDAEHCRQGRLGIGWHFLILVCGAIVLCRDIDTVGSHSWNFDKVSVAVGVVGGVDPKLTGVKDTSDRAYTRNPEQEAALGDLIEVLQDKYPGAEVDDAYSTPSLN